MLLQTDRLGRNIWSAVHQYRGTSNGLNTSRRKIENQLQNG
jgi:hypothetical protein